MSTHTHTKELGIVMEIFPQSDKLIRKKMNMNSNMKLLLLKISSTVEHLGNNI